MLIVIHLILLQISSFQFQVGDILFQDCDCGPICDGIEDVTHSIHHARFSHVAIISNKLENDFEVIEANVNGVKKVTLNVFLKRYQDSIGNPKVAVGRIKSQNKKLIAKALRYMESQIGMPYDTLFLLNNNSFYCSELIYEGFRYANGNKDFFKLYPMTFKKNNESEFHQAFIEYYQTINSSIPEGKMGLNPGSISRDPKLKITFLYKN